MLKRIRQNLEKTLRMTRDPETKKVSLRKMPRILKKSQTEETSLTALKKKIWMIPIGMKAAKNHLTKSRKKTTTNTKKSTEARQEARTKAVKALMATRILIRGRLMKKAAATVRAAVIRERIRSKLMKKVLTGIRTRRQTD